MKVLVACEFSGIVRDAFARRGHDAWSCDLLPSERPGNHIQDDVLKHLDGGWDLMISHPPCTYLSNMGNCRIKEPGRTDKQIQAMDFFMDLVEAPIPRIAIENPIGYPCRAYRKPDQIIQPYEFGSPESKRTCLWLKNLPPLMCKSPIETPKRKWDGKRWRTFVDTTKRSRRSVTFQGIADAMADQWGCLSPVVEKQECLL